MHATYWKKNLETEIAALTDKVRQLQSILTRHNDSSAVPKDSEFKKRLTSTKKAIASKFSFLFEENLQLLQFMYQNTKEGIGLCDENFNIILQNKSFNKSITHIFSLDIAQYSSLKPALFLNAKWGKMILKTFEALVVNEQKTLIIEHISDDPASVFCYEFILSKRLQPTGKIYFTFHIVNLSDFKRSEIKERKEQAALARTSKKKVIKEISSTLAHELIQPLTAIKVYCYGSLNKLGENKKNELILPLEKIAMHNAHALELVCRMRNFMNDEQLFFEASDIHDLIQKALGHLFFESLESKPVITFDFDENIPLISVDRLKIMQLIINLGRNSIEAFRDTKEAEPQILLKTERKDKCIHIHFRDNGPGIPKHVQEKILHSPYTTKSQGTGLGLSICRALVQAHDGTFKVVDSEKGAWIRIYLPIK